MNLRKRPGGFFFYPIGFRHSAALSPADVVWALKVAATATRRIRILGMRGSLNFDGTLAAATNVAYDVIRFTGGNAPTGENAITVAQADSQNAQGTVIATGAIRQTGGGTALTMGGGPVFDGGPIQRLALPISASGIFLPFNYRFAEGKGALILPGEGLALQLVVASAAGVAINGAFEAFEEPIT